MFRAWKPWSQVVADHRLRRANGRCCICLGRLWPCALFVAPASARRTGECGGAPRETVSAGGAIRAQRGLTLQLPPGSLVRGPQPAPHSPAGRCAPRSRSKPREGWTPFLHCPWLPLPRRSMMKTPSARPGR